MTCFHPIDAYQLESGEVIFVERGKVLRSLTLPCGRCIGCRLDRSRKWAIRCMHEAAMHRANSFVTLTYDDKHLPPGGSLYYKHYQLFMKRLIKKLGPVRFYMCGEYGTKLMRPHYHACLFGVDFISDRVLYKRSDSGALLYTSKTLSNLWGLGFATVGDLTFDSAAYTARYVMKKITGNEAAAHYSRLDLLTGELLPLEPEFNRMSLGGKSKTGGIGASFFNRYKSDIYPHDYCVVNGQKIKPPRYYDKLLALSDADLAEALQFSRYEKLTADVTADCSSARLEVREKVVKARLTFKKRSME